MADKKIKITQIKSGINRKKEHKATLRALGFTRLNQTVVHTATPQILGMVSLVGYLCKIEDAE